MMIPVKFVILITIMIAVILITIMYMIAICYCIPMLGLCPSVPKYQYLVLLILTNVHLSDASIFGSNESYSEIISEYLKLSINSPLNV